MTNPTRAEIEQLIVILAKAYSLDPQASLRQCEQESSFRCEVVNPTSGAIGLFQLEPATARWLHVDVHNPVENVWGGLKMMRWARDFFGGDMRKAYAAYDWGPGHLQKLLEQKPADWFASLPPETQNYVTVIVGTSA